MSVLDPNLPVFHLIPSRSSPTSEATISQSQHDSAPTPKYLKRRDPVLTDTYSISLHDAFYPDIVYAAITAPAIYPPQSTPPLNRPRKNSSTPGANSNGSVLPDAPKVPAQISINLHNPDSKVMLTQKPSSWGSGPYWEFNLPKTSFLQPTGSKLDHSLDVTKKLLAALPVATFRWRKEGGVLSRSSLRCSLIHPNNVPLDDGGSGPSSSDPNGKRKASGAGGSEPDITVAIFTNGLTGGKSAGRGEITIFEPNLKRVEVEDVKGLEVTLVMTATAIADMYFGDMRTGFNLGPRAPPNFSGPGRTASFGLQQQVDSTATSNPMQTHPSILVPGGGRGANVSGGSQGNRDSHSNSSAPPPPYVGGPPAGFTGDTKVRPTQEQLFNPTFQQQLRDEERRRQEAAARAEREAREAAARAERERREAARLAEQEAEARRLQEQYEMEAAREIARIEAETRRLRAEFERETAEMEMRQQASQGGNRGNGYANGRPQTQPGATGRRVSAGGGYQQSSPSASWEGHSHSNSMGGASWAPQRQPRPQNQSPGSSSTPKLQPKKSGWLGLGGKTLDQSKDRRRSFMGLRIFGESGGSGGSETPPPPPKEKKVKGKNKLEKKKSGMW